MARKHEFDAIKNDQVKGFPISVVIKSKQGQVDYREKISPKQILTEPFYS